MSKPEAEAAGIDEARRRAYFRLDTGKSNLAPPLERAEGCRFVSAPLNNATADDPGDSLDVVTAWKMPDAFDGVTAVDLLRVLKWIAAGEWREDVRSAEWAGKAVAATLGLDLSLRRSERISKPCFKNGREAAPSRSPSGSLVTALM
jgi:hypothetical protein